MSRYIKFFIFSLLVTAPFVSQAQVYPLAALYASYRNSQYQPASSQSMLLPENYMCEGLQIKAYCQETNPFGGMQLGAYGASWGVPGLGVSIPYYQYWNNNPMTRNSSNQTGCFMNSFATASWYMPRIPCAYDRYRMQSLNKGKVYRTSSSRSSSKSSRSSSRSSSSGGVSSSSSGSSGSSDSDYVPVSASTIETAKPEDGLFMVPSGGCLPYVESYLKCSSNNQGYRSAAQCREKTMLKARAEIGENCVDQIKYAQKPGVEIKLLTDDGGVRNPKQEEESVVKTEFLCEILEIKICPAEEPTPPVTVNIPSPKQPEMRPSKRKSPTVDVGKVKRPSSLPEEIVKDPQTPVASKSRCMNPKEWAETEGGNCAICDVLKQRKPLKDRDKSTIDACLPEPASKYYHEAYKDEEACINNEEDARLHACIGESLKKSGDVMPNNEIALFDKGRCELGQKSDNYPGGKCYSEQVHAAIYNKLKQASKCLDVDLNMIYTVFSHESRLNLNILNSGDPSTGISQLTTSAIKDVISDARRYDFAKNDDPKQASEPCRYDQGQFVNLLDSMKASIVKNKKTTSDRFKCQLTEVGTKPPRSNKSEFFADPAAKQIFIGAAYLKTLSGRYFNHAAKNCSELTELMKKQSPQKIRKVGETFAMLGYNAGPGVASMEMCSYLKYLKAKGVSLGSDKAIGLVNKISHTAKTSVAGYQATEKRGQTLSFQEFQMKVSKDFDKINGKSAWEASVKSKEKYLKGRGDYLGAIKSSALNMNQGGMQCSDY